MLGTVASAIIVSMPFAQMATNRSAGAPGTGRNGTRKWGTNALAVMGIIVPIETAFFSLFIGTANASAVMIGHALGANNKDEAWQLYHFFDRLTLILVLLFSFLLWLSSPLLVAGFAGADANTAALLEKTE